MRNWTQLLFIALLASCGGKDPTAPDDGIAVDGDADTDTDADTDVESCLSVITGIDPEPGDQMVPVDQIVTVEFDVAVPATGHFAVAIDGVTGSTTLAGDGLSMSFAPDAPLDPDTNYTVDAEVCDSADTSTFKTLPPPVPTELVAGSTYALRWDSLDITEPGNPAALQALMPIDYVLLQVLSVDAVTMAAPSVAGVATEDDYGNIFPDCDTMVQQDADFSLNPYYRFDDDLQIVIDPSANPPTVADVEDFHLQALVSADGTALTEIGMSGLVATEQLLSGLDCASDFIQMMNPTCLPCTISDTGQCMLLEGTATSASAQDLDLVTTCGL